ncbi:hypothetical protein AAFF_G00188670 [Aldrovandia affinis]|uniref:Protein SNORC n=1 Tax=Aldrovandia affinis TaxID=143900 RepID=A0AAD7WVV2_9TELE|nr:hypothetical protein AAFF_G00188670 [Aldrovandia affinis]
MFAKSPMVLLLKHTEVLTVEGGDKSRGNEQLTSLPILGCYFGGGGRRLGAKRRAVPADLPPKHTGPRVLGQPSLTHASESAAIPCRPHTGTMAHGNIHSLFIVTLLGLCLTAAWTESVADLPPTPQSESLETSSGGGVFDVTTKDPFHDITENAFTFEYEDATHSQPIDGEDGVLGPGAIAAIVIAVILGASVLIALIVITLKKFTAA